MKLKYILLFVLAFGLYGCPENEQEYFEIQSINIDNVIAESGESLADDSSIEWNLFAIKLIFGTEEVMALNMNSNSNVAIATRYLRPKPSFRITDFFVYYNTDSTSIDLTNIFSTYEYKEPCSNTIDCLNYFASVQFDFEDTGKDYLRFENKPDYDLSDGYFTVKIELEDGTILQDSTHIITITPYGVSSNLTQKMEY